MADAFEATVELVCRDEHIFEDRRGRAWAFVMLDLLPGDLIPFGRDYRMPVLVCEDDDEPLLDSGGR